MAWQQLPTKWEPEVLDYIEQLRPQAIGRDLFAVIDRYTDSGEADDVEIDSSNASMISGRLRAEGHDVIFFVTKVNGADTITIADVFPTDIS